MNQRNGKPQNVIKHSFETQTRAKIFVKSNPKLEVKCKNKHVQKNYEKSFNPKLKKLKLSTIHCIFPRITRNCQKIRKNPNEKYTERIETNKFPFARNNMMKFFNTHSKKTQNILPEKNLIFFFMY